MALALFSIFPFLWSVGGDGAKIFTFVLVDIIIIAILIVPFFLIFNGIVMMKKEGRQLAHMLSLALGIMIFIGEVVAPEVDTVVVNRSEKGP